MLPDYPAPSPVVLVVEDDALVRMMARDLPEDASFEVPGAVSADEALALLECEPEISALFTDIDMPGSMNGLELSGLVAKRWPHIRLVVTSGRYHPGNEDVPDDGKFVPKPYQLPEIVRAIDHAG